jgi:heterotetrameric sarcosine oxidase gamma subunit
MIRREGSFVPDLIAKPALTATETIGAVTLAAWDPGPIYSIALFPGGEKAAAKALKPLGLAMPAPGRMIRADDLALVWTGRDQAFLLGGAPPEGFPGAVTDQSDGWAGIAVVGDGGADLLARLVPLDLRAAAFPPGRVARAGLNHMQVVLIREETGYRLLVFRSMARTAWHELAEAAGRLAARVEAGG